jgi:hypothetical protein
LHFEGRFLGRWEVGKLGSSREKRKETNVFSGSSYLVSFYFYIFAVKILKTTQIET